MRISLTIPTSTIHAPAHAKTDPPLVQLAGTGELVVIELQGELNYEGDPRGKVVGLLGFEKMVSVDFSTLLLGILTFRRTNRHCTSANTIYSMARSFPSRAHSLSSAASAQPSLTRNRNRTRKKRIIFPRMSKSSQKPVDRFRNLPRRRHLRVRNRAVPFPAGYKRPHAMQSPPSIPQTYPRHQVLHQRISTATTHPISPRPFPLPNGAFLKRTRQRRNGESLEHRRAGQGRRNTRQWRL